MGLPIWRDPSETKTQSPCCANSTSAHVSKPPSDLTQQARDSRSTIRRRATVRYPHGTRPGHLNPLSHAYLRGSLRSPPPEHSPRDIPPVPSLPSQRASSQDHRRNVNIAAPEVHVAPANERSRSRGWRDARDRSRSPSRTPFFSEISQHGYRPRSRRGTITNERPVASPSAIDELPPLRRMNRRSINDRSRSHSRSPDGRRPGFLIPGDDREHHYFSEDEHQAGEMGLGDRTRSLTPDADQWETLLTTITPDPSLPSASTSFNSAAASFPTQPAPPNYRPRPDRSVPWFRLGPGSRRDWEPLSPRSRPVALDDVVDVSQTTPPVLSDSEDPSHNLDPTTLQSPVSSNRDSSRSPEVQALYSAIDSLRTRTDRLVSSFCSLAESFRSSSAEDVTPPDASNDDDNTGVNTNEVRALVDDVNALHECLERTVRARAEARAQRVTRGADPLAGYRERPPLPRDVEPRFRAERVWRPRQPRRDREINIEDLTRASAPAAQARPPSPPRPYSLSVTDVLQDREGILTRLRSSDQSARNSALAELPSHTRRVVLDALARSHEPPPLPPPRAGSLAPETRQSANQQGTQTEQADEAARLESARQSLRGMEETLREMENQAREPGTTYAQRREVREARDRVERMRTLLGRFERDVPTSDA